MGISNLAKYGTKDERHILRQINKRQPPVLTGETSEEKINKYAADAMKKLGDSVKNKYDTRKDKLYMFSLQSDEGSVTR